MNRILFKEQLAAEVFRFQIEAPLIAAGRKPGQFVILQQDTEFGERIPLTIADADPAKGTITVIFQRVGDGTQRLAELEAGDCIPNLVGPLGRPTHIDQFGLVVCVGGGIGVAPLYPIAQAMKAAGNRVVVILGARNQSLLILTDEMRAIADEVLICTDDGSAGCKGLVTKPLGELCASEPKPDLVVAIGPTVMMKFCAATTRPFGVRTLVSLNTIMVDGTGMCGGCRVTVGGQVKFVCVDGPEFDGHQVDFESMAKRMQTYREQEQSVQQRCRSGQHPPHNQEKPGGP
ncbi:MAG TPA: sulfide/dihydroorotate dehydrogenase-like FAD/NAD-binding protein [Verrucomicrobiota bacterium]|nr:sulfide/dihydroorotate dehydrogenase-like FAD/NAD-binding protein [Verrucomicrobiota bacterium]HRZ37687.1 sulfide/dihydroorotate dehydrogenase-like FAD/NAD-binding protein [Candidatus Paceibacterota bacterium]